MLPGCSKHWETSRHSTAVQHSTVKHLKNRSFHNKKIKQKFKTLKNIIIFSFSCQILSRILKYSYSKLFWNLEPRIKLGLKPNRTKKRLFFKNLQRKTLNIWIFTCSTPIDKLSPSEGQNGFLKLQIN